MLLTLLTSFTIAFITAPIVIVFYKKNNWVDDPNLNRHVKVTHQTAVPRGGGIIIFLAVFLTALLFVPMSAKLLGILLAALVLMIVGTLDDIYNLSPYLRLGIGLVVGLLITQSGILIEYITNPLGSGVIHFSQNSLFPATFPMALPAALTIVWIVWNMNIVNWSKGLDGQLPGVVAIAALFIGILAARFQNDPSQIPVLQLSLIVSGAYLGFLVWNVYPQKIMPGYGGGSLGGFFLAVLAVMSGAKLATALLVLALPTADALFTIFRRLLRKKSPFWGDRGHLHHKLIDVLGWSKPRTAVFYWMTTALMGLIALQLKPEQKLFTIAVVIAMVFGFLIWAKIFISFSKPRDPDNG